MKNIMLLIMVLSATPAFAQTYVSAAFGAELSKSYESSTDGLAFPNGGGEVISWGLRAGTALGDRWGVELEFNRPGIIDTDDVARPLLSADFSVTVPATVSGNTSSVGPFAPGSVNLYPTIVPIADIRTEQRNTTWNTSAWVRKPLGTRADLVFLAGVGFSRVEQKTEYAFNGRLEGLGVIATPSPEFRVVNYGVGPLVGLEARIRMLEQLTFTPGLRVQSLGNDLAPGLLLRPSLALSWTF